MKIDLAACDTVKGFLDPEEGRRLYGLALSASLLGPCLEIGGYCGRSTVFLGAACQENNSILFSIDHHGGSEEQQPGEEYFDPQLVDPQTLKVNTLPFFRQTVSRFGLEDTVVPIVNRSETVARKWATPLGMVFIDGGHAYDTVLKDYLAWADHVMPGGYLVFHDIFLDPAAGGQAPRQVYEIAAAEPGFTALPLYKTLGILQKTA